MPLTRSFGAVTVIALQDGAGPFFLPGAEAFPGSTAELWAEAGARDPQAVTGGEWLLRFRCFAIRFDGGPLVLVDAGIGSAQAPARTWAPVPGRLPEELAAADIAPDEVDTVVLTHLHTDHIGWAVDGSAGTPYFRNARYLLQRAEVESVEQLSPATAAWLLEPLRSADQLSAVDGEVRLAAGLRVLATPGHTPGHQSVLLETAGGTVAFTGDVILHALQLIDPRQPYALDTDADQARESRLALFAKLTAAGGATLATPHLGEPFVTLSP